MPWEARRCNPDCGVLRKTGGKDAGLSGDRQA